MLENPQWFFRDLSKRNVVVMFSRKAVRILSRFGLDEAKVREVRSGKIHIVLVSDLYEPSNGNEWRGYALRGDV